MYLYDRSRLLNEEGSAVEFSPADSSGDVSVTCAISRKDTEKIRDGDSKVKEGEEPSSSWVHGKYEMGKRMVVADESTGGEEVAVREVRWL